MKKASYGFESVCIKEGADLPAFKPHSLPIYASSAFEFDSLEQGMAIFTGEESGYVYGRYGNPTLDAVAHKIALMEAHGTGLEAVGFLVPSGMSAIYLALLTTVMNGQKVISQYNLYGGTNELLHKILADQNRGIELMDLKQLDQLESKLRNDTSIGAIYIETPSNPDLACVDIATITNLASQYQVKTILDNTFASPYLQQGFRLGVDIVIHSTTKYLNGHGNMIGGVIIGKDPEFMEGKVKEHVKLLGTMSSPFDSWILNNGLKTLSLRMERHCDNAEKIARFLEDHPKISKVNYPGLTSHPDHSIALKQMKRSGGMLSFEVKGGLDAGKRMMSNIQFCSFAPTLGNVDTLILHPASMSHLRVAKEIRERIGITDGLIRLSVGIETVEDIISDLSQSLDKV